MVGDDQQLPPFVERTLSERDTLERFALTRGEVEETLFSVLADRLPEEAKVTLTHQHRMHPAIGQLISECFYRGSLTSSPRDTDPTVMAALQQPVLWVNTSGRADRLEQEAGKSAKNRGEARLIADLADRINWVAEQQKRDLSVAVLTGYDAQRKEIVEALSAGELARTSISLRVATVDSYQGQEADICIFSVTRSNSVRDLGFLRREERINVALSRARDGLVIVGDVNFITSAGVDNNPLFRVLTHIRSHDQCGIEER